MDFQTVRERMAEFLNRKGVEAVCAYPDGGRTRRDGAVAAVSVRACQGGPEGFRDYLGERYDEATGQWQELYGRRITLTLGLARRLDSPRVDLATEPYPGRWTHHFLLSAPEDLDGPMLAWIQEAYAFAEGKGRAH